jgi:hypothetical protein
MEDFRVKRKIRRPSGSRKHRTRNQSRWRRAWQQRRRRILKRLDKHHRESGDGLSGEHPVIQGGNTRFEFAERHCGTAYGGVVVMHQFVRELGLAEAIDERLELLKLHNPYHESDHVLNFAYNALCDGDCLEDMELRRTDEAFLNGLGARRIPDPTTAGDFCRRFDAKDVRTLLDVFNDIRLKVWQRQPASFFEVARIDMDGALVETNAEKKQGIDIAYDGTWGYHPLVVSLANTNEVLSIVNRSGNRPSHEGAAEEVDRVIALCHKAGFRSIVLRGDTDFTQTTHLDRWDKQNVTFIFGTDARVPLQIQADDLPAEQWRPLRRPARYEVKTKQRDKRSPVKEQIVNQRGFENLRLISEEVAELEYRPRACSKNYRLVIVRKNLERRDGQGQLFADYRYFFYLTNDWKSSVAEIVFEANDRCDQENLNAQLKSGVCALTTPVGTLISNWAYMVMTSLAWNLKSWFVLWPKSTEMPTRQAARAKQEQHVVLRMEFKTFVNHLMRLPAHVVKTGRRVIVRLLNWTPLQPILFRVMETLTPRRC